MAGRKKKIKFDPSKNRKLEEFLTQIEIKDEKKEQILAFVEQLTFEKIKEASRNSKKVT